MNKDIEELIEFDRLYEKGESPISDAVYDILKENRRKRYPDHPYFEGVGSPVEGDKVQLPWILGSLNKVYPDDVDKWLVKQDSKEYLVTDKLDGVDFIVTYFRGEVIFAATRGDGYYGQDITEKAKIFCPKPKISGVVTLRGQVMLLGDVHKTLKKDDGTAYKTARNTAAGILNRKDSKYCEHITPFFFEILEGCDGDELDKYKVLVEFFEGKVPWFTLWVPEYGGKEDLVEWLERCRDSADYEIDGLVLTPLKYERENVLLPEKKVAFKINEEAVVATVTGVEWNVTRTGRIVPVVLIEPIEMQGVTVSRATGFNAEFVYDNLIDRGAKIGIVRSGDVIPYITEVYTPSNGVGIGCTECPSCGRKIGWKGVDLVCTYPMCGEQVYYKVEHFLRRMGAENITYKTLMKLGLDTIQKCYEIDEWEIATIDGFGVKRAQQIVDEIQGTLHTTFDKVIAAYGIPGVGRSTGKAISDKYTCEEFFDEMSYEDLLRIDGIGEVTAGKIADNILDFLEIVNYLFTKGMRFEETEKQFQGVQFTLTGKVPMTRGQLQSLISSKGGVVKGISKKTNYLVTADPESNSSKAKKARQYGIEIISYDELLKMLGI